MNQDSEQKMQNFVTIEQISMASIPKDTKPISRNKGQLEDSDLQLHFPIHHTVRTLLMEFKMALKKVNYKCFYMSEKQLFFIRLSFLDRFRKLFMCKQPPKFILTITTHEFLSLRTVIIKPLKSDSKYSFKESRPHQLYDQLQTIGRLLQSLANLREIQVIDTNQFDSEYKQDFYSLDATSYYMFSKMLVDGNYSLGQKILAVNDRFNEKSKLQSTNKEDLLWLSQALNQISDDLLQGFNCSRKELVEILSYCRKSVEQYFHNNHQQVIANEERDYILDSLGFPAQLTQLQKKMPDTYKQLRKLQNSFTSMDIIKRLFMIGLIFKTECSLKKLEQQTINRCLFLIKTCYTSVISDKTKMVKSSGYSQEDYMEYISKFRFDHEITF